MAGARIAAVVMFFAIPLLSGQTAHQAALRVQVQDPTGAVIPGAKVQVLSDTKAIALAQTDSRGEVILSLDPGIYIVRVTGAGFKTWSNNAIDLEPGTDREVRATLRVGDSGSPVVVADEAEVEHSAPEALIPLEPLEPLRLPFQKTPFQGLS